MRKLAHVIKCHMFGDCKRRGCRHSIIYHIPLAGCIKCGCEEFA